MTSNPALLALVAAELLSRIDDAPGVPAAAREFRRRLAWAGGAAVTQAARRHRIALDGLDLAEAADALVLALGG